MYPTFFNSQSRKSLKVLAENESSINYKNLSFKILLSDGRPHEFDFFKRYGTLYSLLENLLTKRTTINSANADQIDFIIGLMHGYDESKLLDIEAVKNDFFYNTVLTNATKGFLDTKKI